jgi:transposase
MQPCFVTWSLAVDESRSSFADKNLNWIQCESQHVGPYLIAMRVDGRKLSREALAAIRRMAVRRVWEGEKPSEVIRSYGLCRTSIYRWLRVARRAGWDALAAHKHPGPSPRLTPEQHARVHDWISGHDPRAYGFESGLWTRAIVASLISDRLNVSLSLTGVGKLLRRIGITRQKPLRRAYERDPEAVREWLEKDYPRIKARAIVRGAEIFFLDETGVRSDQPLGRTWSPRGQTPVVEVTGKRQSINAISAVAASGAFWYEVYRGRLNRWVFIEFLRSFLQRRQRPVFLILDSHPTHVAKDVATFVQSLTGLLELHFLPGYSPDLNPDEFVWTFLKSHGLSKRPLRQGEKLEARVRRDLEAIKHQHRLVKSTFAASGVA